MSIYDLSGNELHEVYDLSGNSLDYAYDLSGKERFSKQPQYPISNVVSYLRSPTQSVADEIKALSDDWQSFIHITDTHGSANKQHSQAVGLYVLVNTPASFLVLGGDYVSWHWGKSEYDTYMAPFLSSEFMNNIYAVLGNHEVMDNDGVEPKQSLYNDFLKDKSNISGSLQNNYYYFDDAERKVRFMFINTSDVDQYHVSNTQLDWIAQNVVLPDSSWSLWVIGHVTLNSMGGITHSNEGDGAKIANAIAGCNGTVIGYLSGHQHCDILYHDGKIQHITMQGDLFSNTNYYDGISVTDRVANTASEQAISVISFNTKTKQVVIRRIGAGRNQTMSYLYS